MSGLAPVRLLPPPVPPPNPLAEAHRLKLAASLLAAAARIGRAAGDAIPVGLSPAALRLLSTFPARGPLRGIDLARKLNADPGQVSRLIFRVMRLGLVVEIKPGGGAPRGHWLKPTLEARALLRAYRSDRLARVAQLVKGLGREERKELERALGWIAEEGEA